ncbi:MAG: glycogen synthase GlgA [Thermoguttaceae bacterium]|nr:glycogen synthase GlgA [Thermoguttaceae bacterium]
MKILIAASEATPFAKTGGLADVAGSIPKALRKLGHEAVLILPAYRTVRERGIVMEPTEHRLDVVVGNQLVQGRLLQGKIPDSDVPVWFIEQDEYFDRPQLYGEKGSDYADNDSRFIFFSRAVLETIRKIGWHPDVIHCNDWQTGLIPTFLKLLYYEVPECAKIATLMTIHNIAYQGTFPRESMMLTGIDWRHFQPNEMEFYGMLSLLKCGLVFSTLLNTVSPRYAKEIQTSWYGRGMEGVLQSRASSLFGVLNGIDEVDWDPRTDVCLAAPYQNYDAKSVVAGKAACKSAIQSALGLPIRPDVPLCGAVGRLDDQKGFNFIAKWIETNAWRGNFQCVLVGTGKPNYHEWFQSLMDRHPECFRAKFIYSESLAKQVIAGSDFFLMPSRFEPCGLTQMYSLRYGTIPVVRETGGLADTITDTTAMTLRNGTANGFRFYEETPEAFAGVMERVLSAYAVPETIRQLRRYGMGQDWSWTQSAQKYVELYTKACTMVQR